MNAPPKLRFTIEQYHQMSEAGILDPLVRTELLRGDIVTMPAKGAPHEVCLTRLNKLGLYAEYGIENYWIFNVQENQLECHASPVRIANSHGGGEYQDRQVFSKTDSVDVPMLAGVRLDLVQIFR